MCPAYRLYRRSRCYGQALLSPCVRPTGVIGGHGAVVKIFILHVSGLQVLSTVTVLLSIEGHSLQVLRYRSSLGGSTMVLHIALFPESHTARSSPDTRKRLSFIAQNALRPSIVMFACFPLLHCSTINFPAKRTLILVLLGYWGFFSSLLFSGTNSGHPILFC